MPLASTRDKHTEVIWGIRDFIHRFNRKPEGMWLPETAVDYETLEVLAEHGVLFTILAPHQAKQVRKLRDNTWIDISSNGFDTSMPYLCQLPSERKIALFFFDHTIANEVAFGNLLENGEKFAERLISTFPMDQRSPKLVSIANDGETYGHHHRFADMALAYAIHMIETNKLAIITNYGEYLEKFPPTHEVKINENTSWSCKHGILRWKENCGCRTFQACLISDPACKNDNRVVSKKYDISRWNQMWRKPLRSAMSWLNEEISKVYEEEGSRYFRYPWQTRDDYVDLIISREDSDVSGFFSERCTINLTPDEITRALMLLEMTKNSLFMMTSCGWFFDEISGIETIQVMMYACRSIQLAKRISGRDFEPSFIGILKEAKSNVPALGNGSDIYNVYVKPAMIDISNIAFYYAVTSLLRECPDKTIINNYSIRCMGYKRVETGVLHLCCGHAVFRSDITYEESDLVFAALHMGEHNFIVGLIPFTNEDAFVEMMEVIFPARSSRSISRRWVGR